MKILGIDPSVACSGYAFVDKGIPLELGKFETSSDDAESVRLDGIYQFFKELVARLGPDIVSMEDQFVGPNPQTSLYLARARGVAILGCYHGGANTVVYSPSQIKIGATGKGKADKAAVQQGILEKYKDHEVVQNIFGSGVKKTGKGKNDDISDALSAAHTHIVLNNGRFV